MTQNEIIELARQAGFVEKDAMFRPAYIANIEDIKGFAKLIAKKEGEACWDIIFDYASRDDITPEDESLLKHLADLIRARRQA